MNIPSLVTVDVVRRGYGRRYSSLPVDTVDNDGLVIDFVSSVLRPEHYDLRVGDTVRWLQDGRYVQALVAHVHRNGTRLTAAFSNAELLPADFFPY
ncbi:hypothetical protein HC891_22085 [Candidatus Gracilibacteria bacterium]|nr:hypothetical protein [Candidatus Gracilibacteria bacterium]